MSKLSFSENDLVGTDVDIHFDGKNTVAVITSIDGDQFVGVARCNSVDQFSKEIGATIAYARATAKVAEYAERIAISRATTKAEYAKRHPNKVLA